MVIDGSLKEEEVEAIEELRTRLKGDIDPELYDDIYLFLRFLKARDFNLNNAETMLRKHLTWREKNDVKNIMKYKKPEVVEKYFSNVIIGHDKDDCVVRYSPTGNIDFIGLLSSLTHEDLTKLIIYETETDTLELKKQTEKLGRNVDKCVYIYNLQNFSFAQATDKKALYSAIYCLNIYINNYPERLKAAYLINVSMYFNFIFAALKTFLPSTILNKIYIYSDDSYKEDILKVIDADVLPAFLGGNRTDPDGNPLCLTFINPGAPIPQTYYIKKTKRTLAKAPDAKKITLPRAAFNEVTFEVKEEGSYLEWEFETKCRDIGFGVFYNELIDDEEKITELVPIQRIDTEEYPETGTFRCDKTGTYVIVFDNTYSWVRSKEIYYRIKVVTPKEHEAQLKE